MWASELDAVYVQLLFYYYITGNKKQNVLTISSMLSGYPVCLLAADFIVWISDLCFIMPHWLFLCFNRPHWYFYMYIYILYFVTYTLLMRVHVCTGIMILYVLCNTGFHFKIIIKENYVFGFLVLHRWTTTSHAAMHLMPFAVYQILSNVYYLASLQIFPTTITRELVLSFLAYLSG